MKVTYIADNLNHHISALCKEFYALLNDNFKFIATEKKKDSVQAYKKGMAFYQVNQDVNIQYVWYIAIDDEVSKKNCETLINASDVVIIANTSDKWIKQRLKDNKLTFRAHERWFKKPLSWYRFPKALLGAWLHHSRYENLYMLTASAYTACDTAKLKCFLDKSYCWGYFPETKKYVLNKLEKLKCSKKITIMWAGRYIGWKHAEDLLKVCSLLKNSGYDFEVKMFGDGPEKENLMTLCKQNELFDIISFMGIVTPEDVRKYMEQANIFLFTSDFQEGWGVVLNEAMNSGCTVIASHAIGSVPYLIKDGINGYIYQSGNIEELYQKIVYILDNPEQMKKIGENAYYTILNHWNSEIAAARFLNLSQVLLDKKNAMNLYQTGICSKAPIIRNDWYEP